MFCKNCNAEIVPGDKFCSKCGSSVLSDSDKKAHNPEKNGTKKNKIIITLFIAVAVIAVIATCVVLVLFDKSDNTDIDLHTSRETLTTAETEYEIEEDVTDDDITEKEYTGNESFTESTHTTTERITTTVRKEPEPGEIKLDSDLQYNMNVFLSNFSEAWLDSFSGRPSIDNLITFGEWYNYINRYEKTVEWADNNEYIVDGERMGNYRIKEEHFISAIKKYFGFTVSPGFAEGYEGYKNGYFYGEFTGAHFGGGFSIVSELNYIGDGIYEAEFDIYTSGLADDASYYKYTSEQMRNFVSTAGDDVYLQSSGQGSAKIKVGDISDRSTYILVGYENY